MCVFIQVAAASLAAASPLVDMVMESPAEAILRITKRYGLAVLVKVTGPIRNQNRNFRRVISGRVWLLARRPHCGGTV